MSQPDWGALIQAASSSLDDPLLASRHVGGLRSASRPQQLICAGDLYSVKFKSNRDGNGRAIVAEQLVPRLGRLIGAPVPDVSLIQVPPEIAASLNESRKVLKLDFDPKPGVHHGSRWAAGYADRAGLSYVSENREGLASLQVLFTWVLCASDFQLIYENVSPHRVLSVDHAHFLPRGGLWRQVDLNTEGDPVVDPNFEDAALTNDERASSVGRLAGVSPEDIAKIVVQPPEEWGIKLGDRKALASYLHGRIDGVVDLFT